ncbi:hypothetical protein CHARACLAT_004452, partial [Characodon lateralis]|nr:hypothetical protein [Characodon lateralis]
LSPSQPLSPRLSLNAIGASICMSVFLLICRGGKKQTKKGRKEKKKKRKKRRRSVHFSGDRKRPRNLLDLNANGFGTDYFFAPVFFPHELLLKNRNK